MFVYLARRTDSTSVIQSRKEEKGRNKRKEAQRGHATVDVALVAKPDGQGGKVAGASVRAVGGQVERQRSEIRNAGAETPDASTRRR